MFLIQCGISPLKEPVIVSGGNYQDSIYRDSIVKVFSWNIHKESNLVVFQDELREFFSSVNPDFLLCQEFLMESSIKQLLMQKENIGWEFTPNLFSQKDSAFAGLISIARVNPYKTISHFSVDKEPIVKTPKLFVETSYKLLDDSISLLIINIHAINFKFTNDAFETQISTLVQILSSHEGPSIVVGDFNTWKKSRIEILQNKMQSVKHKEVKFPDDGIGVETAFGNKLDYIFYSTNYLTFVTGSSNVFSEKLSSDHAALYAEFFISK